MSATANAARHITSTIEVEYIESGTFVGGEEDVFNAGINTGDTCLVITKENLEGLLAERDKAVAYASKIDRIDSRSKELMDCELAAIIELPLGKTIHESISQAVNRVLEDRDRLRAALEAIEKHWSSGNFSRLPELWEPMKAALAKHAPQEGAQA